MRSSQEQSNWYGAYVDVYVSDWVTVWWQALPTSWQDGVQDRDNLVPGRPVTYVRLAGLPLDAGYGPFLAWVQKDFHRPFYSFSCQRTAAAAADVAAVRTDQLNSPADDWRRDNMEVVLCPPLQHCSIEALQPCSSC